MNQSDYEQTDPFGRLLARSSNPSGLCILLILAWMAASDDNVDDAESEILRDLGSAWSGTGDATRVIQIARTASDTSLAIAFNALRLIESSMRRPFLDLAITMALADGRLTPGESHILRLIADVLGLPPSELDDAFRKITGHPIPAPANLGSRHWWNRGRSSGASEGPNTGGGGSHNRERRTENPRSANTHPDIAMIKALAVLGLDEHAKESDIRAAYLRMAQVHHPDRYASLGDEAVRAAEASFRRIKEAYDFLTRR